MSVFSEHVKQCMKEKHYTVGMVAMKTGISKASIAKYRIGIREPNGYNLFLMADALGVDARWLIGYEKGKRK